MGINRDFKGVWIPKEIWLNSNLSMMEKLFLIEIDSLDNDKGCFASNKHFAEFFGITKGRCTQVIKELEKKGLLEIRYEREGKQITKRVIRVVNKLNTPVNKLNQGGKNTKQGYLENAQESNTSNSNTSNSNTNNMSSNLDDASIPYKEIIDYLNDKADRSYRYSTKKTKSLVKSRWNEGFTLEDFKTVINKKVASWSNSNMSNYLRPETLFGTKFESYLNEKGGGPSNDSEYDDYF